MNYKNTLKAIIEYLAHEDFYFCKQYDEIFNSEFGDICYCAEDILQQAHDKIYVAVKEVLAGYYLDPLNDLTEEAQEALQTQAQEQAEAQHIRFNSITKAEAQKAILENQELAKILFDRFTETAHK